MAEERTERRTQTNTIRTGLRQDDGEIAAAVATAVDMVRRDHRLDEIERLIAMMQKSQAEDHLLLLSIEKAADRWKGGFLVIVGLGGVIAWLSSVGGSLGKILK